MRRLVDVARQRDDVGPVAPGRRAVRERPEAEASQRILAAPRRGLAVLRRLRAASEIEGHELAPVVEVPIMVER